uniref:Uncharacterized protein n=1 Tax=Oryza brachyantha TaxID=4533 RepID=J3KZE8_ORYBR
MAAHARMHDTDVNDVFIHDVDHLVRDSFSKAFLCEGYHDNDVLELGVAVDSHLHDKLEARLVSTDLETDTIRRQLVIVLASGHVNTVPDEVDPVM